MSIQALAAAVKRGAARARSADVHDLPAIVHQLLALAGPSCRDIALSVRRYKITNLLCHSFLFTNLSENFEYNI
jgi:hypothetical protein